MRIFRVFGSRNFVFIGHRREIFDFAASKTALEKKEREEKGRQGKSKADTECRSMAVNKKYSTVITRYCNRNNSRERFSFYFFVI